MVEKLGIHNQDKEAPVALCKRKAERAGIEKAVSLCDGLKYLDRDMNVLIKPNLVAWVDKYPYAPYGVITTSRVIEEVVKLLKDFGVKKITMGDGCAGRRHAVARHQVLPSLTLGRCRTHAY